MKAPLSKIGIVLTALLFSTAAAPKHAVANQLFTFVNAGPNSQVVNISPNSGASYISGWSGRYLGQLAGGPVFNVFCVDLNHDVSDGNQYIANTDHIISSSIGPQSGPYYSGGLGSALTVTDYNPVLPGANGAPSQRADEVAYLADHFLNANAATFSSGASGSTDLNNNLTGISLSIWDIMQDGGDGIFTGTVVTDANGQSAFGSLVTYYENLAAQHANYQSLTAHWIQAPRDQNEAHMQDFVYESPVPEPGFPAFLGGLALTVCGFQLLRRRRNASVK